jgi:hypothetical protein
VRVPVKAVTVGAIVGTIVVVAWLLLHAREDPPRGDRGPLALPNATNVDAARDASSDDAVLSDAP